ncbi:tail fiber assembly protein [Citrobacter sp. Cpo126]|uniref:tail fiber assembly protein n=1 Tax=Citrobacter sp. Cpo126 TaxID=2985148 RepID=UPI0025772CCD|nr:tail fiber assembly protein [Citrobacter sp. Cpo126]MDM2775000.1 tail fiber assembly protein [Citrobacter sp. Cpo126]
MNKTFNYVFSPTSNLFYPVALRADYEKASSWPADPVGVSDVIYFEYSGIPPEGKIRRSDANGMPCWIDAPLKSTEELIAEAEKVRQVLIAQANDYINSKQWPGKAAIGRLKGDELTQYNLMLDYLDVLDAIDTSSAPDINWPVPPER